MKAKAQSSQSKAPIHASYDVSYAEIMAEVQKLQKMLDGNIEKKPRKKRTLKVQDDMQVHSEQSVGNVESQSKDDSQFETKSAKNRYKVSNLDEIREKISEVKDLIQEVAPNAEAEAAVLIESENHVSNEAQGSTANAEVADTAPVIESSDETKVIAEPEQELATAKDNSSDAIPKDNIVEAEAQPEIFQAIKEVVEANADANPKVEAAITDSELDEPNGNVAEPVLDEADEPNGNLIEKTPSKKAARAPKTEAKPKAKVKPQAEEKTQTDAKPKAEAKPKTKGKTQAEAKSSLDAYFLDDQPEPSKDTGLVGLAAERHAEELAKHDIKDEGEIIKADLAHDKSGEEWGGSVNLEEDPSLEHPQN